MLTTLIVIVAYLAIIYLHPENLDWVGSDEFSMANLIRFVLIDQFLIECITVAMVFQLIRIYANKAGLTEVRLQPKELLLYELKFLPLLLITFFFFAPFSLTARFLLHYLPDLVGAVYFDEYFYSLKLYINYLPPVLLIGYFIINVNLLRIYNEQLGQTREDLHTTKTRRIKERLMASDEFGEVFVEVEKIFWIEREDRKTFAHTSEDRYRLKESISEIEAKLNPDRFVRINRSSIINLECLLNYSFWENDKYIVRLKDSDKEFVMSRERLQKIKHLLLEPA